MTIDRTTAPAPGPIREFSFPAVERRTFDNGLTLLHARHGVVPLVTVRALIDAGATVEDAGEEGVAWLAANALEGGTLRRSGEDLAWELERLGAELSTWVTWDSLNVSLTARADRLPDALSLLAEIVREPAFPEREVARMRDEQLAEILRRSTEPRGLADDSATRFIYAETSTYHRPLMGTDAQVRRLGRDAVVRFHQRCVTPEGAAIVVVGAVDTAEAESQVRTAFGDWTGPAGARRHATAVPRRDRTRVVIVDRPSAVQSELRIGHVGVPRDHADYFPLLVFNALLGGAFTSRLNLSLREKHGFTYGVRSAFAFRRAAGPFVIQTAVASDVTARAVAETLREIREIQQNGVTEEEVAAARDFIAGTLPLQMQTTEQLAGRIADLHTFDLPTDYFAFHRPRVNAVTRKDVEHVAREHVNLHGLAIVVVGNRAAIEDDLRALDLGELSVHDSADAEAP